MTALERFALKLAVDRARRDYIDWTAGGARCVECGGELADDFGRPTFTLGCGHCGDRRRTHTRRERQRITDPRPEPEPVEPDAPQLAMAI